MGPMISVYVDGDIYAFVAQYMWPFNCFAGASSLCLATRDPLRNSEGAAHTKRSCGVRQPRARERAPTPPGPPRHLPAARASPACTHPAQETWHQGCEPPRTPGHLHVSTAVYLPTSPVVACRHRGSSTVHPRRRFALRVNARSAAFLSRRNGLCMACPASHSEAGRSPPHRSSIRHQARQSHARTGAHALVQSPLTACHRTGDRTGRHQHAAPSPRPWGRQCVSMRVHVY
jgi:hypothetical protein